MVLEATLQKSLQYTSPEHLKGYEAIF
ncbi:MAG: hypothetical protein WBM85_14745 [Eudoraea sp.]